MFIQKLIHSQLLSTDGIPNQLKNIILFSVGWFESTQYNQYYSVAIKCLENLIVVSEQTGTVILLIKLFTLKKVLKTK